MFLKRGSSKIMSEVKRKPGSVWALSAALNGSIVQINCDCLRTDDWMRHALAWLGCLVGESLLN